jgi:hypothetical protein
MGPILPMKCAIPGVIALPTFGYKEGCGNILFFSDFQGLTKSSTFG